MTLILKQLLAFIKLLHSENGTNQIAWGLTLGVFLGFSPFFSLQTILVLMILFFFRVQFGAAFLSAFVFKFVAFLIDPLADKLGQWALQLEGLRPFWTKLYNIPVVPYSRFNNSIVMGSFLVALFLSPVFYFSFLVLIKKYRTVVGAKLEASKAWKAIKASKFYLWYLKYEDLAGH